MSARQLLVLLTLLPAATRADPWRRYRSGDIPSSLQDLDIGLGIGVPDADVGGMQQQSLDDARFPSSFRKVVDLASAPYLFAAEAAAPPSSRLLQPPYLADAQGLPFTPPRYLDADQREVDVGLFTSPRGQFRKVVELSPPGYLQQPLPYQGREERILVDAQGTPVMSARNLGERQIGAFRLRNDRGYQVTMGVPQLPLDQAAGEGVLVMEMKATVYRPVP